MSLRIGETILTKDNKQAKVIDLKWNMVLIQFNNRECDWVEIKSIKRIENK